MLSMLDRYPASFSSSAPAPTSRQAIARAAGANHCDTPHRAGEAVHSAFPGAGGTSARTPLLSYANLANSSSVRHSTMAPSMERIRSGGISEPDASHSNSSAPALKGPNRSATHDASRDAFLHHGGNQEVLEDKLPAVLAEARHVRDASRVAQRLQHSPFDAKKCPFCRPP